MPSGEPVDYAVQDRVALVTLNRPTRMNAFTGEMTLALKAAVARATGDPRVRAIVLTGAGRAFCAGADLAALAAGEPLDADPAASAVLDAAFEHGPGPDLGPLLDHAQRFGYLIRTKKPVIAAVNGPAVGLGIVLALYADIRFASDNATFVTAFGERGLIAEHGSAWLLSRLVGVSNAMDLLISSPRLPAHEAQAIGLVKRVVPPGALLAHSLSYANDLAARMSPRSVAVMKAQVWQASLGSFGDALRSALAETRLSFEHPDSAEGVASHREKRAPRFADL